MEFEKSEFKELKENLPEFFNLKFKYKIAIICKFIDFIFGIIFAFILIIGAIAAILKFLTIIDI